MNRTVRNGVAIIGMAGGMWLLGHAVANADGGTTQTATSTNNVQQSGTEGGSDSSSTSTAKNVNVTSVSTFVAGGSATNTAAVNTGLIASGVSGSDVNIQTGSVTVNQNAQGGNVVNSGNVALNTGPVTQTATAENNVSQTSNADEDKKKDSDSSSNDTANSAEAKNVNVTRVETNVFGGDATNKAFVNTGLLFSDVSCSHSDGIVLTTMTENNHKKCDIDITTGDVTVNQNAKGGDVIGSGNVGINAPVPGVQPAVLPVQQRNKKHAVVSAVVLSSAQPTAVLATTGADYGVPLTLGLIALGAGAGLTAAGRRRRYSTTV